MQVSIHTPTKGVTPTLIMQTVVFISFNPHTHEGCDIATRCGCRWPRSFNPHTHEGCDLSFMSRSSRHVRFQSTHPRRVWQIYGSCSRHFMSFNPHTHEGCDDISWRVPCRQLGFNPHTHEGCDNDVCSLLLGCPEFQSTHPRRVWPRPASIASARSSFQSTHPRRVWLFQGTRKITIL